VLHIDDLPDAPPDFVQRARDEGDGFVVRELNQRENGDCVYLESNGCSIYDRRPSVCRGFDCRSLFLKQSRNERREWIRSGAMSREVYTAARKRLKGVISNNDD